MAMFKYPDGRTVEGPDRCEVRGPTVTPCVPLAAIIERESRRQSPRVRFLRMVSLASDAQREAIGLDLGQALWTEFAFCPLCGARIDGAERTRSRGGTQYDEAGGGVPR